MLFTKNLAITFERACKHRLQSIVMRLHKIVTICEKIDAKNQHILV